MVSINSDSAEEMRHLNQEAAKAMKWGGLTETEALELVTLIPALQLGIADRVGSIEKGKDADLVIYDRHPLSIYAVVQKTIVDGEVMFDRALDLERRPALEAEKKELEKNWRARPRAAPRTPPRARRRAQAHDGGSLTVAPGCARVVGRRARGASASLAPLRSPRWRRAPVHAVASDADASQPIAFVGGLVDTLAGPAIEGATVVVRGGAIVAVGAGVEVPAASRVIDAEGLVIAPASSTR